MDMKTVRPKSLLFLFVTALSMTSSSLGWANNITDKAKETLEQATESLKSGIDNLGDDFKAIQDYLDNYSWKGIIQDKASSGAVTLKHFELNDTSKVVVVKPGETVEGVVKCHLNKELCSSLYLYRVVLGIKGQGPQTTIGNELGIVAGKSEEKFVLTAPQEPGIYQIRFRLVESLFESKAFDAWLDEEGNEPDASTTLGILVVKS
jgi:hypothetical protein